MRIAIDKKMSSFSVQGFQEKLNRLTSSQDSIETLSLWVIHHKAHGKTSTAVWLDNVEKADPDRRLLLLYLANDILQNGRRRGATMFHELFKDPLREAVILTRGQKIHTSVQRMFRIWKERRVYENSFLHELELLIEPPSLKPQTQPQVKQQPEFKLSLLQDAMEELRKFEGELKVKSSLLSSLRIDVSSAESLSRLKDKSAGGRFSNEFEEASQKLQDYCECLGIEVNERINILEMLRECQGYLSLRLSEFQHTAKNFKALGATVNELKEKLQQRLKELERAQSTATSDPSAKEDITDVGDMEIESDNESQEDSSKVGRAPPLQQGVMLQVRHPLQQRVMMPSPVLLSGGSVNSQPMLQPQMYRQQLSPPLPAVSPFLPRPSFLRPQMPAMQPRYPAPPVPRPPQNPGMPVGGNFQSHNQTQPQLSDLRKANTISALPVNYPRQVPPPAVNTQSSSGPVPQNTSLIVSQAVNMAVTTGGNVGDSTVVHSEQDDSNEELKSSLDERLKSLMAQKTFSKVILTDYSDSGSEADGKPYSPSAEELFISNTGSPADDDSIPTPTLDAMTPDDSSPQLNMANPILQALLKSPSDKKFKKKVTPPPQTQPSEQKPSILPDVDPGLLQSILNNVKTTSPDSPLKAITADVHLKTVTPDVPSKMATPDVPHAKNLPPTPPSAVRQGGFSNSPATGPSTPKLPPKGAGLPAIKDLKITPTLTTLLDEIFPQLSKSLQTERKRKHGSNEQGPPSESPLPTTKVPRMDTEAPKQLTTPTNNAFGSAPPGNTPVGPRTVRPSEGTLHAHPPRPGFSSGGPVRPQFSPRTPGVPSGSRMLPPFHSTTEMGLNKPPFSPTSQGPTNRPPFPPTSQGSTNRSHFSPSQGPTNRQPFPAMSQGPTNRLPFPSTSSQGPTNRPTFPPTSQGSTNRPPFPAISQGPTNRPTFPPTSQGPTNKLPFPPTSQGLTNRLPFSPSSQGPTNRPPFPRTSQGSTNRPPFPGPSTSQGSPNRPPFPPMSQGPTNRLPFPPTSQGPTSRPPFPRPPTSQGSLNRPPFPPMSQRLPSRPDIPPTAQRPRAPGQYNMGPPVVQMAPRMLQPTERMPHPGGPTANHFSGHPDHSKQVAGLPTPMNFDLRAQPQGPRYGSLQQFL